jgi:hypothetical protein
MANLTQHQIKCKIQDTNRMIAHYSRMAQSNPNKFIDRWIEEYKKDYKNLISKIEDKSWIEKYTN